MSSFDRRTLIICATASLVGACGFEPVYAPGSNADRLQGRVLVAEPGDADTFLLVENLELRLGRASAPLYALSYVLAVSERGQAVTETGNITRFSLLGRLDYTLSEIEADEPFETGRVESFTGYSAAGSTVETLAAKRDARRRLMVILADKLVIELQAVTELPE